MLKHLRGGVPQVLRYDMMDTLTLQVLWPFAWHARFVSPVDPLLVMRVLGMLEGTGTHHEHPEILPDATEALSARIDLGLQLLAHLLASELPLPATLPLTVSGEWISWDQSCEMAVGDQGEIVIYPSPLLQVPIALPACISACTRAPNGIWRITANWGPLRDEVRAWLDRTLFRYHRRQISSLRFQDPQ